MWARCPVHKELWRCPVPVPCARAGMYPIQGRRYQCKDCPEAVGFDCCGACMDRGVEAIVGRWAAASGGFLALPLFMPLSMCCTFLPHRLLRCVLCAILK